MKIDGQWDCFFSKVYVFENTKDYKLVGESAATFIGGGDRFLSIGRIYNLFTQAMDLRPNSDEGKVEALAAYGVADKELLSLLMSATYVNKDSLSIEFNINKIKYFYDIDWLKEQRKKIENENNCATVQS